MARQRASSRRIVGSVQAAVLVALAGVTGLSLSGQGREWRDYAGGADSSRFVAATEITKSNVSQLQVAWTYTPGQTDFNPLVVRGVVYGRGPNDSFVALDAATGKQLWIHEGVKGFNSRGVNYWESQGGKDRRLIFSSANFLQEIDAQTGETISSFGKDGRVDLRVGSRPGSVEGRTANPHTGAGVREPDHPGLGDEPGVQLGARRHPGVRCANRQTRLDLSYRAAARRVRLRHLAQGRVEDHRRRQQLGRAVDRRAARHHLRPDRQPEVQLLRRQPAGRQSLRGLPRRAQCQDRQASLAFPDGPPRHLGPRQQLGARS